MTTEINLKGSPYLLSGRAAANLDMTLRRPSERIDLLRSQGRLTRETLENFYGAERFEQVAESNAIEGSPLDIGETELAVVKGITISGHDPAYSRDARTLHTALMRLVEMARDAAPTDLEQVTELHGLILGDRPGGGIFRNEEVRIRGSRHTPPRDRRGVMAGMEQWEAWSRKNAAVHPAVRSAVLHAWLTHIHPYLDGNGRTARAVGNLELIRGGYPPIIIRRAKDRDRYLDSLGMADEADLGPFVELVIERLNDAVRDLERAAVAGQGYDAVAAKIRRAQERQLDIWNAAVDLLARTIADDLERAGEQCGATCEVRRYKDAITLQDFVDLASGHPVSKSWAFLLLCSAPGLPPVSRLAWVGYQSDQVRLGLPGKTPRGPSLFWSRRNPDDYPPWTRDGAAIVGTELTIAPGKGDRWYVLATDGRVGDYSPTTLAASITKVFLGEVGRI